MKCYDVSEFVAQNPHINTVAEAIDKKVSMLYHFHILRPLRGKTYDDREIYVRKWLATYSTERQMTTAIHDILVGNTTLDNVLKQKGYMS